MRAVSGSWSVRATASALFLVPSLVSADITTTYGFGSGSASLAASDRVNGTDGFTVNKNLAAMSFQAHMTSIAILGGIDQFDDLPAVVVDNAEIGNGEAINVVDTDVSDTFNFLIGSVWTVSESEKQPRLGLTLSAPVDKLMEPNTKDPYLPSYSMYPSSQTLTVSLGGSMKASEKLSIGIGANYYLTQGATLRGRMLSKNPGDKTSTFNTKLSVRPVLAPLFGLLYQFSESNRLGFTYAGARDARLNMRVDNDVDLGLSAPLAFDSTSSLFFDPEVWSIAVSHQTSAFEIYAAGDYERWSQYDGGYIKVEFKTFQGTFQQKKVDAQHKDILVGRLGARIPWGDKWFSMGLGYRPSPVPDQREKTNYLDSDRVIAGLGASLPIRTFFGLFEMPGRVDTHLQAQRLVTKHVQKSVSTDIGAPGYDINGTVYSYGVSLTIGM